MEGFLMNVLSVRGLCKHYSGFDLKDVSFCVPQGSITGFIGRNGAGKTTTLRSMLGMVHQDAGEVEFFGMPFAQNEREVKQRIGFVSGGVDYYPLQTLSSISRVTSSFYEQWDDETYRRYLKFFSLDETKRVKDLSAGMKVKFALALALSHKADLLILDEPTSGLDPVSRDDLLDVFLALVKNENVSILFSTHITSDLERCADRIVYIRQGEIAAESDIDGFTGRYRIVRGSCDSLSDEDRSALTGLREVRGKYEALISADAAAPQGAEVCAADLQSIMVLSEKENYSTEEDAQ